MKKLIFLAALFTSSAQAAEPPVYDCLVSRLDGEGQTDVEIFTIDKENFEFLNSYQVEPEIELFLGCELKEEEFSCTLAGHFPTYKKRHNKLVPFGVSFTAMLFKIDDEVSYRLSCDERK